MPGPIPKPSAQRRLEGNPSKKPIPDEPKPAPASDAAAPEWLAGEGLAVWHELAPELHRLRLLTKLDVAALAGACWWWSVFRTTAKRIGTRYTAKSHGGLSTKVRRPEMAIAEKAFDMAMGVFIKFGVTPAERMRLAAPAARAAGVHEGGPTPADAHDILAARRSAREETTAAA